MGNVVSGGVGFFGLLQLMFIGLKLTDNIAWSWWWVLSPILGGIVLFVAVVIGLIIVYYIARR